MCPAIATFARLQPSRCIRQRATVLAIDECASYGNTENDLLDSIDHALSSPVSHALARFLTILAYVCGRLGR